MRVGISWDLERFTSAGEGFQHMIDEAQQADKMGFHSVWVHEAREGAADCSAPSILLTSLASKTSSVQLRIGGRQVTRGMPPHVAEEVAVLDTFSRGRAGIAFEAASAQGVPAAHVHELIDFVTTAWAVDELRYRGEHVRFPAHTPDDAPAGASFPESEGPYKPQWEWGPETPDFLSITPKPYVAHPPVAVDINDDETLVWAARGGVSPMIGADVSTEQAVERLARYREAADKAGRARREVEAVLERRMVIDGATDSSTLGGSTSDILNAIREIRGRTGISHLVWRRGEPAPMDLYRFASEIQVLLQA